MNRIVDMPFWEKPLTALSDEEWESLCDCCGLCCLEKLEDRSSGRIWLTSVPCKYLDPNTGLCRIYLKRSNEVSDCIAVDPFKDETRRLLPETCAYRRLYEKKPLPEWHPLLTNNRQSPRMSGFGINAKAVRWYAGIKLENHIIEEIP